MILSSIFVPGDSYRTAAYRIRDRSVKIVGSASKVNGVRRSTAYCIAIALKPIVQLEHADSRRGLHSSGRTRGNVPDYMVKRRPTYRFLVRPSRQRALGRERQQWQHRAAPRSYDEFGNVLNAAEPRLPAVRIRGGPETPIRGSYGSVRTTTQRPVDGPRRIRSCSASGQGNLNEYAAGIQSTALTRRHGLG